MSHIIPKFLFINMGKSFVRATTFTTKKGKKVSRKAYVDKRIAKKVIAKDKIRIPSIKEKSPSQVHDELQKTRDELKERLGKSFSDLFPQRVPEILLFRKN